MPGEELDDLIAPFQIKGLVGSRTPVGTRINDLGQTENVYEVTADPEWGDKDGTQQKYEFEYMHWHQTYHARGVSDPRCTICTAEQQFRQQRAPHEQQHKARGQFDPSCRFCQDDKFFGRM